MIFNFHKRKDLLKQKFFTGTVSLFAPNHTFLTCSDPENLAFTTVFEKYITVRVELKEC